MTVRNSLRVAALLVVAIAALLLTACGTSSPAGTHSVAADPTHRTIIVAADDSVESRVVAALYEQLLSSAGRPTRSATSSYRTAADTAKAVVAGTVDLAPAYETRLLRTFDTGQRLAGNMAATLSMALPVGIDALASAPAQYGVVLAVTPETATRYHVRSLADLAGVPNRLTLGSSAGTDADAPSAQTLARYYHVTLNPVGPSDAADVLELRSTDPTIASQGLVILTDPLSVIPPEHVFPLISSLYVDKATSTALARLNTTLTTSQLATLCAEVSAGQRPARVDAAWLHTTGLLH